jgi:molybdopterin molybdotransferase
MSIPPTIDNASAAQEEPPHGRLDRKQAQAMDYAQALQRLIAHAARLPAETCDLRNAQGRILAADLASPISLPSFDHAAMDGYALAAREGLLAGAECAVTGSQAAGDSHRHSAGEACEIMTGARLPGGLDAVVALEQTELLARHPDQAPARIRLSQTVQTGQNVRYAGSDLALGDRAIDAGTVIDAARVMLLAALGQARVDVVRRPRVAVICTGKELQADLAQPLDADHIYSSNGPYLVAALATAGAEVLCCHTVDDTAVTYAAALRQAQDAGVDLVISTGAVSMGRFDFVPTLLRKQQAEVLFHGVAMRPGKPLLCARLSDGPLLLAMPGTPMAVAVAMRFFVTPLLRAMLGQGAEARMFAILDDAQKPKPGLRHFLRGRVCLDRDSRLHAQVLPQQQPFRIHPFAQAGAWVILPEQAGDCAAGMQVEIASLEAGMPLSPGSVLPDMEQGRAR